MTAATLSHGSSVGGERAGEETVSYNEAVIRLFVIATVFWGVVGFLVGIVIALQLAFPALNLGLEWTSFGRLRPLHTSAVIFAFGGNALFATSLYVVQRTCRAPLWGGPAIANFLFVGYQLFIVLAASGYVLGITQGKEYAEPEWYVDLWLTVVWVVYLLTFVGTIMQRREPHIYVANWFYLAFIVTIAMLHLVNNLNVPVSFFGTASYPLFAGVQGALVQWWYGHNAVGFFLTAGFLGMMYYFIPKQAGRPVYSYRLSIIHFWSLIFLYIWAGPHHLHYTALPEWAQTLGMTFSVMLLVPSWATAANALMTLNGAWHKVRDDATLRFMMVAAIFYGLTTFEGSFLAIRGVNALSHYTDWTVAHVHAGALGWNALLIFGVVYAAVPVIWRRERMWSNRLIEWHFWLAVLGTVVYVLAMWNSGILQGLMWRSYTDAGTLQYPFIASVLAMNPYYVARAVGGTMFFVGTLIGIYNLWMTIRQAPAADMVADHPVSVCDEAGERGVPAE